MRILILLTLFVAGLPSLSNAQYKQRLKVMSYNLLNFPEGKNDCNNNTVVKSRWDTLKGIIDYAQPDILMVCELQNQTGADQILNNALNINGRSGYKRARFVSNRSSSSSNLNNLIFYNSNKVELLKQEELLTNLRDINIYRLYVNDSVLLAAGDTTYLDALVTHFKAGNYSSDVSRRYDAAYIVRGYTDTAQSERNIIFGGDFNFYTSTESGFQKLTSGGVYPFKDPINVSGSWNNNYNYRAYHTQSTRYNRSFDCGAKGGMDSRFDFIFASSPIMSGSKSVKYVPGSYTVLGNNGSTYNASVDYRNTSSIGSSMLNKLYYMSDHLPVLMELEVPSSIQRTSITKVNSATPSLQLYPSQLSAGEQLFIRLDQGAIPGDYIIQVCNLYGQSVWHSEHNFQIQSQLSLQLPSLAAGLYSVTIQNSTAKASARFIVR